MGLRTALGLKAPKPKSKFQVVDSQPTAAPDDWWRDAELSTDWVTPRTEHWKTLPEVISRRVVDILEVGSYEGRSAIAWLNIFPAANIVCIDAWDLPHTDEKQIKWEHEKERRFDRNLSEFAERVEKIKSLSSVGLEKLIKRGACFDLIYIDAHHGREWTLTNSVLGWQMLNTGGVMVWDDYLWEPQFAAKDRPQEAIDWFLEAFGDELEVIHKGYQVAVRRRS